MKKLVYIALIATMCACSLTACGKKKTQTLSDNFANMTDEIQGIDEINAQIQETQAEYLSDDNGGSALDLENAMSGEASSETAGQIDEANTPVSEDGAEMSVSEDGTVSDDMVSENAEADFNEANPETGVSMDDYFATMAFNNTLTVSNLSGKDLKEVYATFNTGTINNVEITCGKKLKDGNKVGYVIADIESLKNASNIVLTINAVNKKGETISFGDVRIVDPSNMNIVLVSDDEGYSMYTR